MSDVATRTVPRLKAKYHDEIKANLQQQLGLANVMQVPKLEKIVINMGVGRATQQPSLLEGAVADPRPSAVRSRSSPRQALDRRLQAARGSVDRRQGHAARRPHVGVPRPAHRRRHPPHPRLPRPAGRSWDGRGNYTFGLAEQTVFPEIDYDKIDAHVAWTSPSSRSVNDQQPQGPARRVRFPVQGGGRPQRARSQPKRRGGRAYGEEEVGHRNGKEVIDQQGERQAQVQGACIHVLPQVR